MKESFEELLQSQEDELASMRVITAEVFATLQINEQEFIRLLHDKSRYTLEEWASIQKHRTLLTQALERRLSNAIPKAAAERRSSVAPHWVFVR